MNLPVVLDTHFFERPTLQVAQELLGKYIVNPLGVAPTALCITEVEAYIGTDDLASHARAGKTVRTAPMYEAGGVLYVYFIYGKHYCCNVVTEAAGFPAAILIRAGKVTEGITQHIIGPGRVCRFLGINTTHSNISATQLDTIHFEDRGVTYTTIETGPRIGVTAARELPWRFTAVS